MLGLIVLLLIGFALSRKRRSIRPRIILWGVALQLAFAAMILKTAPGRWLFDSARAVVYRIMSFTDAGAEFVFGGLAKADSLGFVFAFQVLPTIIFFSSLMSVLYHLGVMQKIVVAMAKIMTKAMGVSGSESLATAANVFVGQTEAPLVVRPYIAAMTTSELMALMTGGFATIAGGVLVAYVRFGIDPGHLLAASVMSAPAALVMAKLIIPETEESKTAGDVRIRFERETVNVIDAAAAGAGDGLRLALNVAAMLLAFVALVAMANYGLGVINGWVDPKLEAWLGFTVVPDSLEHLLAFLFRPVAFCMGVEWKDTLHFGTLIGQKIVLNEFIAYLTLKDMIASNAVSPRTISIATYALCGFASFGSVAIQIGGIGALAPERRHDLAKVGLWALAAGALASFMTATVAAIMI